MRTLSTILFVLGFLTSSCSKGELGGATSPEAVLEALLAAVEDLDSERVTRCLDTMETEAAKSAGAIGRLVKLVAKGKKLDESVRSRFGDAGIVDPLPTPFPIERWREGLARGAWKKWDDGAQLTVPDRRPVQFVLRMGRWYVFSPSLFDPADATARAQTDRVIGTFEKYYDDALQELNQAKDVTAFRTAMEQLGRKLQAEAAPLLQSVMQSVWSTGR